MRLDFNRVISSSMKVHQNFSAKSDLIIINWTLASIYMLCSSIDKKKLKNINNVIEVMTCVRIGEGSRLE